MEPKAPTSPAPEVSRFSRDVAVRLASKLINRFRTGFGIQYEETGLDSLSEHPESVAQIQGEVIPTVPELPQREVPEVPQSLPQRATSNGLPQRGAGNPEGFGLTINGSINDAPKAAAIEHVDPFTPSHQSQRYIEKQNLMNSSRSLAEKSAAIGEATLGRTEVVATASTPIGDAAALAVFNADPLGAPKSFVSEAPDTVYQNMVSGQAGQTAQNAEVISH